MPAQLPEFIKVDLSGLTSKSTLGLQNVKLPNGVKAVVRGSNKNPALISIKLPEVAPDASAAPQRPRPLRQRRASNSWLSLAAAAAAATCKRPTSRGPFAW